MEESQVTKVEQYTNHKNNFSQEIPLRKPRTEQCGKTRKQDEFWLRIIKALEEGNQLNRHLSFFTDIVPSLQNLTKRSTLSFRWEFFS